MEVAQKIGVAPVGVRDDQVLVRRHERDRVHEDAKLLGTHGEDVEVELPNGRVGSKEVVATQGTAGDHHGVAWEHEGGLSHAWRVRTKHARAAASDFKSLPLPKWRIPSEAAADGNQGAVAPTRVGLLSITTLTSSGGLSPMGMASMRM